MIVDIQLSAQLITNIPQMLIKLPAHIFVGEKTRANRVRRFGSGVQVVVRRIYFSLDPSHGNFSHPGR
jgi:hypothetical protein